MVPACGWLMAGGDDAAEPGQSVWSAGSSPACARDVDQLEFCVKGRNDQMPRDSASQAWKVLAEAPTGLK